MKASNIKYILKHNFDFNKLFDHGVCYQRLCDEELVRAKVEKVRLDNPRNFVSITSTQGAKYTEYRSRQSLGNKSEELL